MEPGLLRTASPCAAGFYRRAAGCGGSGAPAGVARLHAMPDVRERLDAYRLSFDDWLRLPDQDGLCEVIDGELFVTPAPSVGHQWAVSRLALFLARYLEETGSGMLFQAPTALRLGDDTVQPDLMAIAPEDLPRIGGAAIGEVPRLVVEALSPGTARRDLGVKKEGYAAAGVPEYWIVDPIHRTVERLVLGEAGYETAAQLGPGETLGSPAFPGLAIPLDEVFPPG